MRPLRVTIAAMTPRTLPVAIVLITASLFAAPLPASGSSVDDVAVLRHCGAPVSEDRHQSPVTNEFMRDMYYPNDVVIHFLPIDGGWQLASAWMKHIPVTRDGLANRMPCVRDALAEAALAPKPEIDSTIAAQTVQQESRRGFGIPFLWLIFFLVLTLLVYAVIPTPRKPTPERPNPRAPQRLPDIVAQEKIRDSSSDKIQQ